MENILQLAALAIVGGAGLFILYQAIKHWKFVFSYLLMPLSGMLVMALFMSVGQINDTVHPLLLGMAGVACGGLLGHLLALRNHWV